MPRTPGFRGDALRVLSVFNWGDTFVELNAEAFALYAARGHSSEEVEQLQEEYLREQQVALDARRLMNRVDYQDIANISQETELSSRTSGRPA